MLGRLFARSFSGAAENGLEESSLFEERETKELLYGPQYVKGPTLDLEKDMRVVVLVDGLEFRVYDSATSPDLRDHPVMPGGNHGQPTPNSSSDSYLGGLSGSMRSLNLFSKAGPGIRHSTESIPRSESAEFSPNRNGSKPYYVEGRSRVKRDALDGIPLQELKEAVFGHTPIMFTKSMTKLHPLMNSRTGSNSTNAWLVSRIFKVVFGDQSDTGAGSSGGSGGGTDIRTVYSEMNLGELPWGATNSQSEPSNDESQNPTVQWNPVSTVEFTNKHSEINNQSSGTTPLDEVRCAITVLINLKEPVSNSQQTVISSHWEELSRSLADLELVVSNELIRILPQYVVERHQGFRILSSFGKPIELSNGSLRHINEAVSYFKRRYSAALRVPRLIYGQDRWLDLCRQMSWVAQSRLEKSNELFLSTAVLIFLRFNSDLILSGKHFGPTRTVLMGTQLVDLRRFLFILTSFLHDSSSKRLKHQMEMLSTMSVDDMDDGSTEADSDTPHVFTEADSDTPHEYAVDTADEDEVKSIISARRSSSSPLYLNKREGWEIPKSPAKVITASIAVPSATFSSSMANSRSRLNALNESGSFYNDKSIVHLSRPSFGSYFAPSSTTTTSCLDHWDFDSTDNTPATSLDDNASPFMKSPSFPSLSGSISRPGLHRWHSSERTATTVNLSSVSGGHLIGQSSPSRSDSGTSTPLDSRHEDYFDSEIPDEKIKPHCEAKGKVLEVDPTSYLDIFDHIPITLPPIAGCLPDFHPDFMIQADKYKSHLEDTIAKTMVHDAEIYTAGVASNNTSEEPFTLSRTLIINLKKREIFKWALVRSQKHGIVKQALYKEPVYQNRRPAPKYMKESKRIMNMISSILGSPDADMGGKDVVGVFGTFNDNNVMAMKKAYDMYFNVL